MDSPPSVWRRTFSFDRLETGLASSLPTTEPRFGCHNINRSNKRAKSLFVPTGCVFAWNLLFCFFRTIFVQKVVGGIPFETLKIFDRLQALIGTTSCLILGLGGDGRWGRWRFRVLGFESGPRSKESSWKCRSGECLKVPSDSRSPCLTSGLIRMRSV